MDSRDERVQTAEGGGLSVRVGECSVRVGECSCARGRVQSCEWERARVAEGWALGEVCRQAEKGWERFGWERFGCVRTLCEGCVKVLCECCVMRSQLARVESSSVLLEWTAALPPRLALQRKKRGTAVQLLFAPPFFEEPTGPHLRKPPNGVV